MIVVFPKFMSNNQMETHITCRYRVHRGLDLTPIADFTDVMSPHDYDGHTNEVFRWGFKDVPFASLRGGFDKSENISLTLSFTILVSP